MTVRPRRTRDVVLSGFTALCVAGCSIEAASPTPVSGNIGELPVALLFSATASGTLADGRRIDCGIETLIDLGSAVTRGAGEDVRSGTGGGEAKRFKQLSSGNSVQFWADTGFPDLQVAFIGADSMEIRSPSSADVTERFWKAFARFAGKRHSSPADPVIASGAWTCHPMDTPPSSGEYYDVEGSMPGTWVLQERVSPSPLHR